MQNKTKALSSSLLHYGVKGMKWGVRKERPSSGTGWSVDSAGRIEISPGTPISRVVRNHKGLFGGTGGGWDSGGPVYAAFKPVDTAGYAHFFGRSKSLLVKEASTVQKLIPTKKLLAPGPKESASIFFKTVSSDPEALESLKKNLHGVARMQLSAAIKDPTSPEAYNVYALALDAGNYSKDRSMNQKYYEALKKSGYNMLLDPSDAMGGFDAPIIVLDGKKSLKLKSQTIVDKNSQKSVRLAYKSESRKAGASYLEKLGYL